MRHRLSTLLGGAALIGATATGPVSAAGADHAFFPEHYDAYEHFAAGEGFCVSWAGTFHEVRHGGYRLVAAPGGQQPGELHINGVINGNVELIPDDRSLPTYAGDYREKLNGIVTEFTDEGDVERIGQFRLRTTLRGTDGSSLNLKLSGKVTFNANGVATVERDTFTCE
jgi:hypothetical protein